MNCSPLILKFLHSNTRFLFTSLCIRQPGLRRFWTARRKFGDRRFIVGAALLKGKSSRRVYYIPQRISFFLLAVRARLL